MERFSVPQNHIEKELCVDDEKNVLKYIENINFDVLRDILSKLLQNSEVSEKILEKVSSNLIGPIVYKNSLDKVYRKYFTDMPLAEYSPRTDKVGLGEKISNYSEDYVDVIIFHEIIHSVSDYQKEECGADHSKSRLGLSFYEQEQKGLFVKRVRENRLLNEGVTQLVAEAVYDEYSRRIGSGSVISMPTEGIYAAGKKMVELLVKNISHKTGVPEEVVFLGVVRSMFNYDYDDFFELVKGDPDLLKVIENIKDTNSDLRLFTTDPTTRKQEVDLSRITPTGAQSVSVGASDFNPLIGKLV